MNQYDYELEQDAIAIAGNSNLVKRVPQTFQRIPGLEKTRMLRRLDYYDFSNPSLSLTSSVFNTDINRFEHDFNKFRPAEPSALLGSFSPTTRELRYYRRDLLKEITNPSGGSYQHYNGPKRKEMHKLMRQPAEERTPRGFAVESDILQTRQEMIAYFAHSRSSMITQNFDFSVADVRAFIDTHEMEHARSYQLWCRDRAFLMNFEPELVKQHPEFTGIWQKTKEADYIDGDYTYYLAENMSDTVAALHHLKNGGSIELVQAIADARAMGNINAPSVRYASHWILDEIIKDEAEVRAFIDGKSVEEIELVAAELVGSHSFTFEEFNVQAMACYKDCMDHALKIGDKMSYDICQDKFDYYLNKLENPETALRAVRPMLGRLLERRDEAARTLCADNELSYEDHKVEVLAAVRHAQDMHPEFAGAEGGKYLLAVRERYLSQGRGIDADEAEINQELSEHLDITDYGNERAPFGQRTLEQERDGGNYGRA